MICVTEKAARAICELHTLRTDGSSTA